MEIGLDKTIPTHFELSVYELCSKIPCGKVTTYGEIAKALGGGAQMARAVGNALNKNPYAPMVPCHRVVRSDGTIGGFASGCARKKEMLIAEGIEFDLERIKDFSSRQVTF